MRKVIIDEIVEEFISQFKRKFGASKTQPTIFGKKIEGGKKRI